MPVEPGWQKSWFQRNVILKPKKDENWKKNLYNIFWHGFYPNLNFFTEKIPKQTKIRDCPIHSLQHKNKASPSWKPKEKVSPPRFLVVHRLKSWLRFYFFRKLLPPPPHEGVKSEQPTRVVGWLVWFAALFLASALFTLSVWEFCRNFPTLPRVVMLFGNVFWERRRLSWGGKSFPRRRLWWKTIAERVGKIKLTQKSWQLHSLFGVTNCQIGLPASGSWCLGDCVNRAVDFIAGLFFCFLVEEQLSDI